MSIFLSSVLEFIPGAGFSVSLPGVFSPCLKSLCQSVSKCLKKVFFSVFLLTLFENTLKYTIVCQQANINRQQATDIAENRTFSYQQIHAKKAFSLMSLV